LVLGGRPIKHEQIAAELNSSIRSVQRNLARLKDQKYIETIRAAHGEIIKVRRSKKWPIKQALPYEVEEGKNNKYDHGRSDKNGLSLGASNAKSGISDFAGMTDMAHLEDKSGTSNKILYSDILQKNNRYGLSSLHDKNSLEGLDGGVPSTGGSVPQEIPSDPSARIEHRLAELMGQLMIPHGDLMRIQKLLEEGIPEKDIIMGIDIAFSNFRPKFPRDRIRSISYCEPLIWDIYHRSKDKAITREGKGDPIHRPNVQGNSKHTSPSTKRRWDDFEYGNGEE
jgi:hypothetical protein